MKKVSLVFSQREELWSFLGVSNGVNVSIHHKLHCLTAEFSPSDIELATETFKAQVFESIHAPKPPHPKEEPAKEQPLRQGFGAALLL